MAQIQVDEGSEAMAQLVLKTSDLILPEGCDQTGKKAEAPGGVDFYLILQRNSMESHVSRYLSVRDTAPCSHTKKHWSPGRVNPIQK